MSFCGVGILSNCNCAFSSFYADQFTPPFEDAFLSKSDLLVNVGSTDSITVSLTTPDTVSYVCSNADGFTECGSRQISFTDLTSNMDMTTAFPYKKVSKSCTS